jgi:hypothetical protein
MESKVQVPTAWQKDLILSLAVSSLGEEGEGVREEGGEVRRREGGEEREEKKRGEKGEGGSKEKGKRIESDGRGRGRV